MGQEGINEINIPTEAPKRLQSVYDFLQIEEMPLSQVERVYIKAAGRNIQIQEKDGQITIQSPEITQQMEAAKEQFFAVWPEGNFADFLAWLREKTPQPESKTISKAAILSPIKGNFISQTLEGKGTCLDFALTAMLFNQVYKLGASEVKLVPYNLGRLGKPLSSSFAAHYGLTYTQNNEAMLASYSFRGLSIPAAVAGAEEHKIDEYIRTNWPEAVWKDNQTCRRVKAHILVLYRKLKGL